MRFTRHCHLLILVLPVVASANPNQDEAIQILDEYAYGLQYIITSRSGPGFAAPPDNPLRVRFASPDTDDFETISVKRFGEDLFDMEEVWIWADIEGTMIDAGRSETEEEILRELAAASGGAYEIKQPKLLVEDGSIRFHGLADLGGFRVNCREGGLNLTNNNGRNRKYETDFLVEWQDETLCSIGDDNFRRVAGVWRIEQPREAAETQATMARADGVR